MELELVKSLRYSIMEGNWKTNKLQSIKDYQKRNKKLLAKYKVSDKVKKSLEQAYSDGGGKVKRDLERIMKDTKDDNFFGIDDNKLKALTTSTTKDFKKAENAVLRTMDDAYRQTIFKTEVELATGNVTLNQAIDNSTKSFLEKGINCIKYSDGKLVNIASWSEMALRTANRRATLSGEGAVRKDWKIHTVLITQYGACSPICLPWQGKVYIDDVYSGGKKKEAEETGYSLLSTAIENGLFHPNCRHKSSTFFEGVSSIPERMPDTTEVSLHEAEQRYNERNIRKYKRLETGSVDDTNKQKYGNKVSEWQAKQRALIRKYPNELRRDYSREQTRGVINVDTVAPIVEKIIKKPETLKEKVDAIKANIKKLDDEYQNAPEETNLISLKESVLQRKEVLTKQAGKLVMDDLSVIKAPIKVELEEVQEKIKSYGLEELKKKKLDINKLRRDLISPEEIGYKTTEEAFKDYLDISNKINKISFDDNYVALAQKQYELTSNYNGTLTGNISELKTKLSEVRPVGKGNNDLKVHLNSSRSPMRSVVEEAYDCYPTDWVDKSVVRGNLTPKAVDRGFYSDWTNEIAISGGSNRHASLQTAIHELGHRYEKAVPEIKDAEKVFYNRRTKDETLEWLGGGYDKREVTRFDKFLDGYMGKDYGESAYELVSMGFQMAYTNPTALWKDPDMAEWIYGILTTY